MNLVAYTNHVDWSKIALGNSYFWSELHLLSKIIEKCYVSTIYTIFAIYEIWWKPHHCHSQHLVFVQGMGLMTHGVRKVGFSFSKYCGLFNVVGHYETYVWKIWIWENYLFERKHNDLVFLIHNYHMPYTHFKNILLYEIQPWTKELLLSILHFCRDQKRQLFSVCCSF